MNEVDLITEWLSFPGLNGRHISSLAEAGVTTAAWIQAGHLTTPRIRTAGRLFQRDPFGEPAFVLPIYDGEPVSELAPEPSIPLVDLVAFKLEEPDRWWLRIGAAGLVLGKDQLFNAMLTGSNITLHSTPFAWLQAGCDGACPLDLADDLADMSRTREHLERLEAA